MLRQVLAPIHPDGWRFIGIAALATLVLFWLSQPLGWIGLIFTLWVAYFFRDPWRVTPTRPGLVVSPADGLVVSVGPAVPPAELGRGRIVVRARRDGKDVVIDVIDNGIGLPKENRARLLEPYVTTREKGTGLGLAIVGRILEEHGGRLELRDASEKIAGARGAWMQLRFGAEQVSEITSEPPPLEARAAAE